MPAAAPIFQQIRKESTRDKVHAAIRQAILSGRLQAGERISEVPLAAEFHVSRAIVREALLQLSHEGLVEQNSYKGTRVILLTPEQVDEMLQARVMLEVEVVRQAVSRLTPAQKKDLLRRARELDSLTADPESFAALDLELHRAIWEASGNQTLRGILHQLTAPLFAMGTILRYSTIATTPAPYGEHMLLVRSICNGPGDEAAEAMRRHIFGTWKSTRERLQHYLAENETRRKP